MTATPPAHLQQAARTLLVDLVTAETSASLRAHAVEHVLLKGPSLVRWLYRDGTGRSYTDSDLLVEPGQVPQARRILGQLGFRRWLDPEDTPAPTGHAEGWLRAADGAIVDLHWSLVGVHAQPEVVWSTLSARTEVMEVAGAELPVLDLPARALQVGLHAAQHGAKEAKSCEDLRRALRVTELPTWREAAGLAHELRATEALGEGLRLFPEGREIADQLSLPGPTVEAAIRATTAPPVAMAMVYLTAARGWRARTAFLFRELLPSPRFMEIWSPLARRSRRGLVAAYLFRPFWLLAHLPAGVQVWLAARRRAARTDGRRG